MKLADELRGARNIPLRVGLRVEPVHPHEEDVQRRAQNIGRAREPGVEFLLKLREGLADSERIVRRHGEPRLRFRGEKEGKIEKLARRRGAVVEKLLRKGDRRPAQVFAGPGRMDLARAQDHQRAPFRGEFLKIVHHGRLSVQQKHLEKPVIMRLQTLRIARQRIHEWHRQDSLEAQVRRAGFAHFEFWNRAAVHRC
jgi:hypothetical protein